MQNEKSCCARDLSKSLAFFMSSVRLALLLLMVWAIVALFLAGAGLMPEPDDLLRHAANAAESICV